MGGGDRLTGCAVWNDPPHVPTGGGMTAGFSTTIQRIIKVCRERRIVGLVETRVENQRPLRSEVLYGCRNDY